MKLFHFIGRIKRGQLLNFKFLMFCFTRSPILPSSIQSIEAIHYAIDLINNDTSILPGVNLGLDLYGLSYCGENTTKRLEHISELAQNMDEQPIVGIISTISNEDTEDLLVNKIHNSMVGGAHSAISIHVLFTFGLN